MNKQRDTRPAGQRENPWLRLARGAGWTVLALFALAVGIEKSGLLHRTVHRGLQARLGLLGRNLAFSKLDVHWLELAAEVRDLSLGEDGEILSLERVRVDFSFAPGPRVERLTILAGKVRLSADLLDGLRSLMGSDTGSESRSGDGVRLPEVFVRGVEFELEQPDRPALALGRVDADLEVLEHAPAVLRGRVVPAVSGMLAPSEGIFLSGTEPEPGRLSITAFGRNLPLSLQGMTPESLPAALHRLKPRARFALSAGATVSFASEHPTTGTAHISIDDGFIAWPNPEVPVEDLQLQLAVRYRSSSSENVWDMASWHGRGRVSARWQDAVLTCGIEVGDDLTGGAKGPGAFELWLKANELPFNESTVAACGAPAILVHLQGGLEFRGRGSLRLAVRAEHGLDLEQPIEPQLEIMLEAGSNGHAGLAYHGWIEGAGFPYPMREVRGQVLYHRRPDRARRMLVSLVDIEATHASDGPARAYGVIASARPGAAADSPRLGKMGLRLFIAADRIVFDERLRRAFDSFQAILPNESILDVYQPARGLIDLELGLWQAQEFKGAATSVQLDLERTDLTWSFLPVPLRGLDGQFGYVSEGYRFADNRPGNWHLNFSGAGSLQTAEHLTLTGNFTGETVDGERGTVGLVAVEGKRLSLTGADVKILGANLEAVRDTEEWLSPRGFVDIEHIWTRPVARGAEFSTTEISPAGPMVVRPQKFQMLTRNLGGRVRASTMRAVATPRRETRRETEGPTQESSQPPVRPVTTTVLAWPLIGTWGRDVEVAALARFESGSGGSINILGAGIDASDGSFLGSISDAMRTNPGDESKFQSDAFRLEGKIDFQGEIDLPPVGAPEDSDSTNAGRYVLHTRDCRFITDTGVVLEDLRGKFRFEDGRLYGPRIEARLGRTPVRLEETRFEVSDGQFVLETDIFAHDMPLDPDHLGTFLDAETLSTLVEHLSWSGSIDIEKGHLTITGDGENETRRRFQGDLTLTNVFLQLGLPFSIRSARARVEDLIFEGGAVRGWGHLEDLYGQVIDRNLGPARMQLSYYDKRLTLEGLDGTFEGGSLQSLAAGRALSIDLEPPFPFEIGLSLGADGRGADVGALLKGLFPSNIADRGLAFGTLRLKGDLEGLVDARGDGMLRVRETLLWSIPVVRDLFVTLGIDESSAQFDSFETAFEVGDGAIHMRDIDLESDILHLVGDGRLGLDGSLDYRLQLQYGLVNKLGPLRMLLYWIQNNLLTISIGGDMARPEVSLRTLVSLLFGNKARKAHLPLPDLSTLPERF